MCHSKNGTGFDGTFLKSSPLSTCGKVETETFINITFNTSKKLSIFIKNKESIKINKMDAKFIGKAKLTKQGQLTLPQEARQDLKIEANSDVYWYEFNDILVLVKELVNPKELVNTIFNKKKKR